jgi:hypothetical protein
MIIALRYREMENDAAKRAVSYHMKSASFVSVPNQTS